MGKQALLDGITKEPKAVYFVWTRTGHTPRYAHPTRQRAVAEAQRLALLNPGKKFIVMHCLGKYSASSAAGAEAETAQAVTP